jgi:hypothetical protein
VPYLSKLFNFLSLHLCVLLLTSRFEVITALLNNVRKVGGLFIYRTSCLIKRRRKMFKNIHRFSLLSYFFKTSLTILVTNGLSHVPKQSRVLDRSQRAFFFLQLCPRAQGNVCRGLACVLFRTRCYAVWRVSPTTHRMFVRSDGGRVEQQRAALFASCLNCFD